MESWGSVWGCAVPASWLLVVWSGSVRGWWLRHRGRLRRAGSAGVLTNSAGAGAESAGAGADSAGASLGLLGREPSWAGAAVGEGVCVAWRLGDSAVC